MVHGKETEMMVSVIMITYGHEKYIEEAINGVFIQQTDFPVELIIANDCSPDQTDEVVKLLLRRAPENITVRYTKHQTNKGMNANFVWAASQATGKYIALCEGDDYWTDPLKLQKQYDFLEGNDGYTIHSGLAKCVGEHEGKIVGFANPEYSLSDFYTQNRLITCTVMFKNIKINYFFFENLTFGDWMLYVNLLFESGKKAFVSDEIFSNYRIHNGGMMKKLSKIDNIKNHIQQILRIKKFTNPTYTKKEINKINTYFIELFKLYLQEKKYRDATIILIQNIVNFSKSFYWKSYAYYIVSVFR